MNDKLWYKDAIIYETHVKAFFDSTNDGIGDFPGLMQKLDYLQDLGINCLWLLPFFPSPLKDDGYDISAYRGINPLYGTMRDFRRLVKEAHRRGIRVIIELVINHTSDQHRWFQAARNAPHGSVTRNYYVWSDTDQKYKDARIIFTDSEKSNWSWDPVAKAYYWHRFFYHQPDLNFENPAVVREVIKVLRFWLDQGVDGLRLDAVPYLIEQEGTNCENLEDTHTILKQIRKEVDLHYQDRMLLAEANQWPADVRPYFGDGDECHMAFNFPLMPRIFMALRQEDRHPITDIMRQIPEIPGSCQWGLFLRNHDELTLEMVTDEERDYMYKAYAADPRMRINIGIRRRLAPLMDNSRRRIELLNSLLFSFKGTPILYYGDELGMGDNIYLGDRNGVRTPMQWSSDRNAGFSRADFAKLYSPPIMDPVYGYQSINVEAQLRDPSSLLIFMKRMIALRTRTRTFGRGTMDFLLPANRKVLAYVRKHEKETILCVANLSRFVQPVELDLSEYAGLTPVEMLGQTEFPRIGMTPYFLTPGPHSFYWFALQKVTETITIKPAEPHEEVAVLPVLVLADGWSDLLDPENMEIIQRRILPQFLASQRWFPAKGRSIETVKIVDSARLPAGNLISVFLLIEVSFVNAGKELYAFPISLVAAIESFETYRESAIARVRSRDGEALLVDAMADDAFCTALLNAIAGERQLPAAHGVFYTSRTPVFNGLREALSTPVRIGRGLGEQSNTSVVFNDALILKLFRKLEYGINPEFEILNFLTLSTHFDRAPRSAGAIEYSGDAGKATIASLQNVVPNQGNAWNFTIEEVERYLERATGLKHETEKLYAQSRTLSEMIGEGILPFLSDTIGMYLQEAYVLGKRTAELHVALSTPTSDSAFQPEPMTPEDYQTLANNLSEHATGVFKTMRANLKQLAEGDKKQAKELLNRGDKILQRLSDLKNCEINIQKIRIHGDYHLGQVLWVKNDFVIIDFEGEPARPLPERRQKQLALKDVAGMIRSFNYAAYASLFSFASNHPGEFEPLEPWANAWQQWTSAAFLKAYLEHSGQAVFLPASRQEFMILLDLFLLDKALYEIQYEINNRPAWVRIPITGILALTQD